MINKRLQEWKDEKDLICVSEDELKNKEIYFVDKDEIIRMFEDNIVGYIKKISDKCYEYSVYDDSIYYIICPLNAPLETQKLWIDVQIYLQRKGFTYVKNEDIVVICHDECCQTWDCLDLNLMDNGYNYTNCIVDHCDYEKYDDEDISNLTEKIEDSWGAVKKTIKEIKEHNTYGYAYKMNGFCMIIEKNTNR